MNGLMVKEDTSYCRIMNQTEGLDAVLVLVVLSFNHGSVMINKL